MNSCYFLGLNPSPWPLTQRCEESEQQFRHFVGPFLLDPVPGAVDDFADAQIIDPALHVFHQVEVRNELQYSVAPASDETGRPTDARAAHSGQALPIALLVAIAVQRSAEAANLELRDVVVDVLFSQPARQCCGIRQVVEHSFVGTLVGTEYTPG